MLRPQLRALEERAQRWNNLHRRIESGLSAGGFRLPGRPGNEQYVASSIQFDPGLDGTDATGGFVEQANRHGVAVKWFGRPDTVGFTSRYDQWRYTNAQSLPATAAILRGLCDMRIPLVMTEDDADLVVEILSACRARAVIRARPPASVGGAGSDGLDGGDGGDVDDVVGRTAP